MIPSHWAGTAVLSTPHTTATTSRTMPSKNYPKNLTGIYLGAPDSGRSPLNRSFSIPPLIRGRGQKFRVKTSSEERRNRMVELIRLKEEKRGFGGNPLRKKLVHSAAPALHRGYSDVKNFKEGYDCVQPVSPRLGRSRSLHNTHVKDPYSFIRMNPRQYTAAINSGMTHFEYLVGGNSRSGHSGLEEFPVPPPYLVTDLDVILGMEECYRVICKGNTESLLALSPESRQARSRGDHTQDYTGFAVRSYRNPHLAELLPDFVRTETQRESAFPCPKLYSPQRSIRPLDHHNPTDKHLKKSPFPHRYASSQGAFEDHHLRVTGTGTACLYPSGGSSTNPEQKRSAQDLKTGRSEYADIKRAWNSTSLISSASQKTKIEESAAGLRVVARSMPPEQNSLVTARQENTTQENSPLSAESTENDQSNILSQNMEKVNCDSAVVKPTLAAKKEDIPSVSPKGSQQLSPKPHAAPIISLDNEDGESKIVDIDEEELLASGGSLAASREDLSDTQENKENVEDQTDDGQTGEIKTLTTKSRSSEAIVASIKENAEQRQKDFEKLLDEHAVLVQEITRASSSDNLTQENTRE